MTVIKKSSKDRISQPTIELTQKGLSGISRALIDLARSDRLSRHFKRIRKRLDKVLTVVDVDPDVVTLATRHVLCAEALAEALEHQAYASTGGRKTSSSFVMTAYARIVAEKLRHFHERTDTEQRRISRIYPEVNLHYVVSGCERGMIQWESAAVALEESHEYDVLMKRMNAANLLDV